MTIPVDAVVDRAAAGAVAHQNDLQPTVPARQQKFGKFLHVDPGKVRREHAGGMQDVVDIDQEHFVGIVSCSLILRAEKHFDLDEILVHTPCVSVILMLVRSAIRRPFWQSANLGSFCRLCIVHNLRGELRMNCFRSRFVLLAVVWSFGIAGWGIPGFAQVTMRTVARTGASVPGAGNGVVFAELGTPSIDSDGRAAFVARLSGPGIDSTNDGCVCLADQNGLRVLVREGDAVPDALPGTLFASIDQRIWHSRAGVQFAATLTGPGVPIQSNTTLWRHDGNSLRLVARARDQAPGFEPGVVFGLILPLQVVGLTQSGVSAFFVSLAGPGIDAANSGSLWLARPDGNQLILQVGDPAPGFGDGAVFSSVNGTQFSVNDAGEVLILASVYNPATGTTTSNTLWLVGPEDVEFVAAVGRQVPGYAPGVTFSYIDIASIGPEGRAVFVSRLAGPGIDYRNQVLWVYSDGMCRPIARMGEPIPGYGTTFTYLLVQLFLPATWPHVTASGGVTFPAWIAPSHTFSIVSTTRGFMEVVIREGDPAPGALEGAVFHEPRFAVTNALRQFALSTNLRHPPGTPNAPSVFDYGVWATDRWSNMRPIVVPGTLFDVNDDPLIDDLRVVRGSWIDASSSGADGNRTALNDSGELAFSASFRDGSWGVFIATIESVPCGCDWNSDFVLDSQDLFDFLGDFHLGDADFNGSGGTNTDDFFAFLACFQFTGCP